VPTDERDADEGESNTESAAVTQGESEVEHKEKEKEGSKPGQQAKGRRESGSAFPLSPRNWFTSSASVKSVPATVSDTVLAPKKRENSGFLQGWFSSERASAPADKDNDEKDKKSSKEEAKERRGPLLRLFRSGQQ
jgi:hypothetical protein